jgi:hypothetical protein
MENYKKIITECRFCKENIKNKFVVNGLIITCPYCNKPQE